MVQILLINYYLNGYFRTVRLTAGQTKWKLSIGIPKVNQYRNLGNRWGIYKSRRRFLQELVENL